MRNILKFELRKIWYRKAWTIPALIAAILVLWITIGGGLDGLRYVLSGKAAVVRKEMQPLWGKSYTQEVREYAKGRAEEMGIVLDGDPLMMDVLHLIQPVAEQYGEDSAEYEMAFSWLMIYTLPSDEENMENYETMLQSMKEALQTGQISRSQYRQVLRASDPMPYEIVPGSTAWQFWLDSEDYLPLLSGVGVLALLLVFFSDVFSREEGGGLREISLSRPRCRQWILAKVLATAISSAGIVLALYGGLLLILGLIFGFQGWNCSPLAYAAGGYIYGDIGHNATSLTLGLLRLAVLTLGGTALGTMIAACSAVTRRALPAMGMALLIFFLMESLLFIECSVTNYLIQHASPLLYEADFQMIRTILTTPVRLFLNVEVLTMGTKLMSNYSNLMIHNMTVTPDLLFAFILVTVTFMALCIGLCFTYRRQR